MITFERVTRVPYVLRSTKVKYDYEKKRPYGKKRPAERDNKRFEEVDYEDVDVEIC
jgi:hypothetical protein